MKKILFVLIILMTCEMRSFSQELLSIDFDNNSGMNQVYIDSTLNNNIWQIGTPHKIIFNSGYCSNKAIVTDTLNNYPINDTSIFYVKHYKGWGNSIGLGIDFYYQIDSDSLHDYGFIEVSVNNSNIWYNVMDTLYHLGIINDTIITGRSAGWQLMILNTGLFIQPYSYDSLIYKFTFISDSIQSNKEGWIIDDIFLHDFMENIPEINSDYIKTRIYPNPASQTIIIYFEKPFKEKYNLELIDNTGKLIERITNLNKNSILINVEGFTTGQYYYKIIDSKNKLRSSGKFMIKR